ncbi:pyruvate dehydrogenase E2 component (dihydrolipoamide acetyltransferase) [Paraburkholderia unamae]|uniref:dihydrolipoamide acetyltransferase family protein n=1 Tax=Paraburkholderia unamae TaxID=219649 RepID=UPI000DC4D901|nr:dihydrolipoamide acetyltransferase family protein [Paraburkholderia unamae]RAR53317.1 pyruvate dehydrogenase E2 component (dihydrolipoamide acetyltransferase) [Paraburkholderia unamae]
MRRELLVPKLGLTMAEGMLVEWMVSPGEAFEADQGIFVIESEKAATEIAAEAGGRLIETCAEVGRTLPVGSVIGYWDDGKPDDGTAPMRSVNGANGVNDVNSHSVAAAENETAPAAKAQPDSPQRVVATPLARRLAAQRGIDLRAIRGTGPRGRIRAGDLDSIRAGSLVEPGEPVRSGDEVALATPAGPAGRLTQPSAVEQTIARRLSESKREIPHFYLAVEAEVSRLEALRRELKASQTTIRTTINHFILAAVGRALADMPQVNRVWTDHGILNLDTTDVGMAVHTERGLAVPVLRDVASQSIQAISSASQALAERAHARRLSASDTAGGAITVSNAGMHDVTYMSSIINPGQAMILGVGSIRELFRPDAAGLPALRKEMGLVLSADHRVLDGVNALAFLKRVVGYLEQPLTLLVT